MSMEFVKRLVRLAIDLVAQVSETSIYQDERFTHLNSKAKRQAALRATRGIVRPSKWRTARRVLIIYAIIKHSFQVIIQYAYDFSTFKYSRYRLEADKYMRVGRGEGGGATAAAAAATTTRTSKDFITNSNSNSDSNFTLSALIDFDRIQEQLVLHRNRVSHSKAILKFIGAPFINFTIIIEICEVFLIWLIVTLATAYVIYYKHIGPFNVGLFRVLYDEKREQANLSKLILEEKNKVLALGETLSSKTKSNSYCPYCRNALFVRRASKVRLTPNDNAAASNYVKQLASGQANELAEISFDEQQNNLRILLERLVANDSLRPKNRRPKWISFMSGLYLYVFVNSIVITTIINVAYMYVGPIYLDYKVEFATMDVICLAELEIIILVASLLYTSYATSFISVMVDQVYAIKTLEQIVDRCIDSNMRIYQELSSVEQSHESSTILRSSQQFAPHDFRQRSFAASLPVNERFKVANHAFSIIGDRRPTLLLNRSSCSGESISSSAIKQQVVAERIEREKVDKLNENLLFTLMHYRIFVRQVEPLKHYFSFTASLVMAVYFLFPPFALLHAPYLSKKISITLCLSFWALMLAYDLTSMPFCTYHARCGRLFDHMFRLIARIDELESIRSAGRRPLFNPHLVTILRRQIDSPELAINRVSLIILGSPLNYGRLLRMHFWVGLLSLYSLTIYEISNRSGADGGPSILGLLG